MSIAKGEIENLEKSRKNRQILKKMKITVIFKIWKLRITIEYKF